MDHSLVPCAGMERLRVDQAVRGSSHRRRHLPVCGIVGLAVVLAADAHDANSPAFRNGRLTLPSIERPLGAVLAEIGTLLGAEIRISAAAAASPVLPTVSNLPIETALARLLDRFSYSIDWRRDWREGAVVWRPTVIRVGTTGATTASEADPRTVSDAAWPPDDEMRLFAAVTNAVRDLGAAVAATMELAQRGSPSTVDRLFDGLAHVAPGVEFDHLARAATSQMRGTAAGPVVAAYALSAERDDLRAAAIEAAARLADGELLASLEAAHAERLGSDSYRRVLEIVRRATSPCAQPVLERWADEAFSDPASARALAALQGLASVGRAPTTDALFDRLARAPPSARRCIEDAILATAPTAEALAALRFAAEGSRTSAGVDARLLAVESLARFPDSETLALFRRIAAGDGPPKLRRRCADHVRRLTGGP